MKKIELAWAAGFYDGEGSSKKICYHYKTKKGIRKAPTKNIMMSVSQAELEPLLRFQNAVKGIGHINGPYQYNTNKRPYWIWSASCKSARIVFKLLKPYLSSIKKKQYLQVDKELYSVKNRKKGWIHDEKN